MATSIIVARALNPEGKGIYALAGLLPALLMYFTSVGLGAAAAFYVASGKYPADLTFGNGVLCVLAHSACAVLIGLGLVLFAKEKLFAGIDTKYLLLALLIVPSQLYLAFVLPILLGLQKIWVYSILQVLRVVTLLGMTLIILTGLKGGVAGALVAEALASLSISVASFFVVLRETKGICLKLDKGYLKDAYRYGGRLYAGSILLFLNGRSSLLLLNWYLNPAMVGFFTLGVGLSEKVWLVADAVGTVLFPKIASEKAEDRKNAFTPFVFRGTLLIVTLVSFLLYVLAEWLVTLLYSTTFLPSVTPFRILLIGVVASSGWRILQSDLNGRGRPGLAAGIMAVSLLVNIALNLALIPRLGITGAAWAAVFSAVTSVSLGMFVFRRVSGVPVQDLILLRTSDFRAYRRFVSSVAIGIRLRLTKGLT